MGLCTHDGPDEFSGQLIIRFVDLAHEVEARLSYDGRACKYSGFFSENSTGYMTCNNTLTLPLRLWTTSTSALKSAGGGE